MTALRAAAERAWHEEGWEAHELPEIVLAEARRLGVTVTPAEAQRIAAEVAS
jgi:DNA polymerase III delta subunit